MPCGRGDHGGHGIRVGGVLGSPSGVWVMDTPTVISGQSKPWLVAPTQNWS